MTLLGTNPFYNYWVSNSGKYARELLAHNRHAIIQGISSRGIFLKINSSWIIFLSTEDKRGPLTLNLRGDPEFIYSLESGMPVNLSPQNLYIASRNLLISMEKAAIWQAPSLPKVSVASDQKLDYLASVYQLLESIQSESRFIGCLPYILFGKYPEESVDPGLIPIIAEIMNRCRFNRVQEIVEAMSNLIGWGSGLTPSGDDLISGFVLGVNRWGERLFPQLNVDYLNREIVKRARNQTNLLSANLIECACYGEADERLLNGLDGIIAATAAPIECVNSLASWGNTSGIDALTGMAIFATSQFSEVMN